MGCTAADVVAAIRAAADAVAEHRVELIQLDRAIGDGDHGENLDRGFRAVLAAFEQSTPDSPSAVLKTVASTLISKVGGAAGPLYGTAFLRASAAVKDKAELGPADVVEALTAALGGVVARGKAEPGDKTMVDALAPAVQAATAAAGSAAADSMAAGSIAADSVAADSMAAGSAVAGSAAGGSVAAGSVAEVLAAAAAAAEEGAQTTVPLVARKGRASYLGERSAGHLDPGARSTALLLRAFAEVAAR